MLMLGVLVVGLESTTRRGVGGGVLAGVVALDTMSPPSPSLSMAESSINWYLLRDRVDSDLI